MLLDSLQYDVRFFGRRHTRQSDQNDAGMHLSLTEHKLAKILVAGEQKPVDIIGSRQHLVSYVSVDPAPTSAK